MSRHIFRLPVGLLLSFFMATGVLAGRKDVAPTELKVTTTPDQATISCDGKLIGSSPATISGLPPGPHLIEANKKDHRPARKTVTLQPEQRRLVELDLEPITGIVIIHSNPSGAAVQVNGAAKGETPLLLTHLPLGEHRVKVSITGHQPKELDLAITDRTPRKLDVDLTTDAGSLFVDSRPSGAKVTLDGISKGTTPCSIKSVPRGQSTLELSLAGYEPDSRTIRLAAGQDERLTVQLKPIPSSLMIFSIPEGARIYLDNEFRGTSPVTLKDLKPGSYRIRAELPAHSPMARTVAVGRAETVREEFRFQSNAGTLQITTQPAGATVFIDGKDKGETQAKGTDQVSEPLTIPLVVVGDHEVTVSLKGYFEKKLTVSIAKDQTTTKHVALQRRFIKNYEVRTTTSTYTGVLVRIDPDGDVVLEIRPGVFKTLRRSEIISKGPLRSRAATP